MQGLSEGLACTRSRTPGPQPSPVLSEIRALSSSPGSDCRAGALRRVRTERVLWVLGPGTWVHAEVILVKSHAHLSGFPFLLEFSGSSLELQAAGAAEHGLRSEAGPAEPAPSPAPRGPVPPPLRPSPSSRGDPAPRADAVPGPLHRTWRGPGFLEPGYVNCETTS